MGRDNFGNVSDAGRGRRFQEQDCSLRLFSARATGTSRVTSGGVVNIQIYASDVAFAKPTIAAQSTSVKMVESVDVEDSWLIWLYRMAGKGFIFELLLAYVGLQVLAWWIGRWSEKNKSTSDS
jgi:hypothetical protein